MRFSFSILGCAGFAKLLSFVRKMGRDDCPLCMAFECDAACIVIIIDQMGYVSCALLLSNRNCWRGRKPVFSFMRPSIEADVYRCLCVPVVWDGVHGLFFIHMFISLLCSLEDVAMDCLSAELTNWDRISVWLTWLVFPSHVSVPGLHDAPTATLRYHRIGTQKWYGLSTIMIRGR